MAEIWGNTRPFRWPGFRWFSKLDRVGSGIWKMSGSGQVSGSWLNCQTLPRLRHIKNWELEIVGAMCTAGGVKLITEFRSCNDTHDFISWDRFGNFVKMWKASFQEIVVERYLWGHLGRNEKSFIWWAGSPGSIFPTSSSSLRKILYQYNKAQKSGNFLSAWVDPTHSFEAYIKIVTMKTKY